MHRLKRKKVVLKSKCRGDMGPTPREDPALQLALGRPRRQSRSWDPAPQTRNPNGGCGGQGWHEVGL